MRNRVVSALRNFTLDRGCELRNYPIMTAPTLAQLIKSRGLRPADVARALGVDKATVTRWVRGRVPVDRLEQVEKATGIPAADLRPDVARVFASHPDLSPSDFINIGQGEGA